MEGETPHRIVMRIPGRWADMNDARRRWLLVIFILLTGFLAGTAAPELFRMGTGDYAGLASRYGFQKYQGSMVLAEKLLPYIVSLRLRTLLFLWMSSFTAAGIFFHLAYAWWLAASAGLLVSLFVLRDGYDGFILFVCCLMPQWILYAAMWKQEGAFLLRCMKRKRGGEMGNTAALQRRELLELGKMMGLCVLGCAVEAFLGRWTLKIFLKIFS